jgi:hypothetical protein
LRISVSEIKDYIKCPLFYKMKYIDELPITKSIDEYFREYLKLTLSFYYFSIIEKKNRSFDGMTKRWEQLWFSTMMLETFPEEELKERSNEASLLMSNFIKRFGDEKSTPIAVNFQYEALFQGKENLHVTGEIDLIKILNDRTVRSETCICMFSLSKSFPDIFLIKNDVTLSVASHAFRSNFKAQEDKMMVINIRRSDDTPTLRTSNDFIRAEKAIRNVCTGIKNGVYYPSPNTIYCTTCPFRMFCLNEKSINMGETGHARG